jgi:hypothetical protein
LLAALLAAAGLVACGGVDDTSSPLADPEAKATAEAMPAPLFDDRGRPLLAAPGLVPADTAARSRSGLYASAAQYEWEALTVHPYTMLLDLDALGSDAAALASAAQVLGGRDSAGVAYYVRARDPVRAARLADALSDRGFAPVFVVRSAKTPG